LLYTIAEVAALFRVSEPSVSAWIRAGMPIEERGKRGRGGVKTAIDLERAVRWYFQSNYERLELDRQRARLTAAQAELANLKHAETAGDLAPLSVIERSLKSLFAEIRTNVLALPSRLAPELEGQTAPERQATIERAAHEILDRLAAWTPRVAAGGSNGAALRDGVSETAGADGERVGGLKPRAESRGRRRAR